MQDQSTGFFLDATPVQKPRTRSTFRFSKRARRLAFLMCKGGVGKTTLSFFLGLRLSELGARVLCIDSDPQSNLTISAKATGTLNRIRKPVLVDVLARRAGIRDAIVKVRRRFHILPSSAVNSMLERDLLNLKSNPVHRLDEVLKPIDSDYDYIIIDCAPTLNIFNASVAFASDLLLIPFQLNEFSKIGLEQTVSEIQDIEKQFQFRTEIRAVLNCYQPNDPLTPLYLKTFGQTYKSIFLNTVIRQSPEIGRSFATGEDFFKHRHSSAKEDFDQLAAEISSFNLGPKALNARYG